MLQFSIINLQSPMVVYNKSLLSLELVSWMSELIIDTYIYPKSISHSNNLDQVSKQAGSSRKSSKKRQLNDFFYYIWKGCYYIMICIEGDL